MGVGVKVGVGVLVLVGVVVMGVRVVGCWWGSGCICTHTVTCGKGGKFIISLLGGQSDF